MHQHVEQIVEVPVPMTQEEAEGGLGFPTCSLSAVHVSTGEGEPSSLRIASSLLVMIWPR